MNKLFFTQIMLSNSSKYALKAVLYLAVHANESNKIMVKDIAAPINVPQAYIAKLLQELSRKHLISSKSGKDGGFYLNEENINQSVIKIIEAIDGENKLNSCLLSLEHCNENNPCPLHHIANPYRAELISKLSTKSIKDLSLEVSTGRAILPL